MENDLKNEIDLFVNNILENVEENRLISDEIDDENESEKSFKSCLNKDGDSDKSFESCSGNNGNNFENDSIKLEIDNQIKEKNILFIKNENFIDYEAINHEKIEEKHEKIEEKHENDFINEENDKNVEKINENYRLNLKKDFKIEKDEINIDFDGNKCENNEIFKLNDENLNNKIEKSNFREDFLKEESFFVADSENKTIFDTDMINKDEKNDEKSVKECLEVNDGEIEGREDIGKSSGREGRVETKAEENIEHQEESDDDDIRPGSCREQASSEDEVSSWDDENDQWVYDSELIRSAKDGSRLPKVDISKENLLSCEEDLKEIIEIHIKKEKHIKDEVNHIRNEDENINTKQKAFENKVNIESKEVKGKKNSINKVDKLKDPSIIPTSGKFFMHDLREGEEEKINESSHNIKQFRKDEGRWQHDLFNPDDYVPTYQRKRDNFNTYPNRNNKQRNRWEDYSKQRNYNYDNFYYDNSYYYNEDPNYYDNEYYPQKHKSHRWNDASGYDDYYNSNKVSVDRSEYRYGQNVYNRNSLHERYSNNQNTYCNSYHKNDSTFKRNNQYKEFTKECQSNKTYFDENDMYKNSNINKSNNNVKRDSMIDVKIPINETKSKSSSFINEFKNNDILTTNSVTHDSSMYIPPRNDFKNTRQYTRDSHWHNTQNESNLHSNYRENIVPKNERNYVDIRLNERNLCSSEFRYKGNPLNKGSDYRNNIKNEPVDVANTHKGYSGYDDSRSYRNNKIRPQRNENSCTKYNMRDTEEIQENINKSSDMHNFRQSDPYNEAREYSSKNDMYHNTRNVYLRESKDENVQYYNESRDRNMRHDSRINEDYIPRSYNKQRNPAQSDDYEHDNKSNRIQGEHLKSKYSEVEELTNIKITVDRSNIGPRQIKSFIKDNSVNKNSEYVQRKKLNQEECPWDISVDIAQEFEEEMPSLSERELHEIEKRFQPMSFNNQQRPRFNRMSNDKSSNRAQPIIPKRYSEMRTDTNFHGNTMEPMIINVNPVDPNVHPSAYMPPQMMITPPSPFYIQPIYMPSTPLNQFCPPFIPQSSSSTHRNQCTIGARPVLGRT